MFDAILDLQRRRRMQSGLPQVTGNIQAPQVGPDIQPPPPQQPMLMAPAPMMEESGDNLSGAGQLLGGRAMQMLLHRMKSKPTDPNAMQGTPILRSLFRR